MHIDISFLPAVAAAYLLTFARVGTMVMLLPGVGELSVPVRVRLTMALVLAAIVLPLHQKAYTINLQALGPVLVLMGQEMLVGAMLGLDGAAGDFRACKPPARWLPSSSGWALSPPSIRRRTSRA